MSENANVAGRYGRVSELGKALEVRPIELAELFYAVAVDVGANLVGLVVEKLEQESALCSVFSDIEIPLVAVLSRIERQGALLSRELIGL